MSLKEPITKVPYASISRYEDGFVERWVETCKQLTLKTQFVGGERIARFEEKLAKSAGVKHAVSCANGTDAIQLALRAVGVGPGDLVLIPDLTFWATFEAVCNVGARPVTVDVDPEDFHMPSALLAEALDLFRPKAVVLVHLYGWLARETSKMRDICRAKGVPLIEDTAQAWGSLLDGKSVFEGALVSTTSFYPGKVLGAAGDGGAVLTNDPKNAHQVRLLSNHGQTEKYYHSTVGWNSRLDVFQAEFLSLSLDYVAKRIESRRQVCDWYRREIRQSILVPRSPAPMVTENGYIAVATVPAERRDPIFRALERRNVGYGIVYPCPVSRQAGATPHLAGTHGPGLAASLCQQVINLPCFAYMQPEELAYVKQVVDEAASAPR